ncbi:MAG: hypothetical protein GY906_34155, partial [bacterium]|nr:hypothetical protein [bacterium]
MQDTNLRSLVSRKGMLVSLSLTAALSFGCAAPEVEVMAIANAGFLVRSSHYAVLVDALYRPTAAFPQFYQQAPSSELLDLMLSGGGPFANIDLLLVTHAHEDHFDPDAVSEFMRNHPESILVGPVAMKDLLAEQGAFFEDYADRVLAPELMVGECVGLAPGGIEMTTCRVLHSGGTETANNVYWLEVDGFRFLHEGDADSAPGTLRDLDLPGGGVDLALLHDWYVFSEDGRGIMASLLRPQAVVLTHLRWSTVKEKRKRLAALDPEVTAKLPPVTVFAGETARARFSAAR